MKKRFIVLVDFSTEAANLIQYASEWATSTQAEILLIHQPVIIYPAFANAETKTGITTQTHQQALQKLNELSAQIIPSQLTTKYLIASHDLQKDLMNLLAEDYEDLFFVNLQKVGFLEKLFIGNPTLQLIENLKNVIVALPEKMNKYVHKRLFVEFSEQRPLDLLEFNNLLKFIDEEQTELIFFNLSAPNEPDKDIERQLRNLTQMFSDRIRSNYAIYEGLDPFSDIKRVITNTVDEILVLQRGTRLLTDRLFSRFVLNDLVYEGKTPLIVLP